MGAGLLGADALHAMFTPHAGTAETLSNGETVHYGYGWFLAARHGHRLVFHQGDNAGFHAFNACLPDDETTVIVLTNDEEIDTDALGLRLVDEGLRDGGIDMRPTVV